MRSRVIIWRACAGDPVAFPVAQRRFAGRVNFLSILGAEVTSSTVSQVQGLLHAIHISLKFTTPAANQRRSRASLGPPLQCPLCALCAFVINHTAPRAIPPDYLYRRVHRVHRDFYRKLPNKVGDVGTFDLLCLRAALKRPRCPSKFCGRLTEAPLQIARILLQST